MFLVETLVVKAAVILSHFSVGFVLFLDSEPNPSWTFSSVVQKFNHWNHLSKKIICALFMHVRCESFMIFSEGLRFISSPTPSWSTHCTRRSLWCRSWLALSVSLWVKHRSVSVLRASLKSRGSDCCCCCCFQENLIAMAAPLPRLSLAPGCYKLHSSFAITCLLKDCIRERELVLCSVWTARSCTCPVQNNISSVHLGFLFSRLFATKK